MNSTDRIIIIKYLSRIVSFSFARRDITCLPNIGRRAGGTRRSLTLRFMIYNFETFAEIASANFSILFALFIYSVKVQKFSLSKDCLESTLYIYIMCSSQRLCILIVNSKLRLECLVISKDSELFAVLPKAIKPIIII